MAQNFISGGDDSAGGVGLNGAQVQRRSKWLKALETAETRISMALEEARSNYHKVRGFEGYDNHDADFDWLQREVRSAVSDIRNWNGDDIKF